MPREWLTTISGQAGVRPVQHPLTDPGVQRAPAVVRLPSAQVAPHLGEVAQQRNAAGPLRAAAQTRRLQQGRQHPAQHPEQLSGALLVVGSVARATTGQLGTGVRGHGRRTPVPALRGLATHLVDQRLHQRDHERRVLRLLQGVGSAALGLVVGEQVAVVGEAGLRQPPLGQPRHRVGVSRRTGPRGEGGQPVAALPFRVPEPADAMDEHQLNSSRTAHYVPRTALVPTPM
ncbi:hypothetical protein ABXI76_34480 [Streptomyces parvus]